MSKIKNINRRDFLKYLGGTTAALTLASCGSKSISSVSSAPQGEVPTDKMTYKTSATQGDKVSLLGYGCMRWPELDTPTADGCVVDQQAVNELVDYAMAHGVNYFDTAPVYHRGWSERATGVALSRYPRESYYIATKLSNMGPPSHSKERSIEIYKNSFDYLQVDYIDYLLLHFVGLRNFEYFESRFINNGMLDYLIEERAAGRIRNLGFSFHGDLTVFDHLLERHDQIKWDFVQIQLNYVDWLHASSTSTINTDAVYLYGELEKRGIDVIVMEPILGGRLATIPEYLAGRLREQRPADTPAKWAFRFAADFPKVLTVLSGMTYMEHLQENIRTFAPLEPLTDSERELLMETADMMTEYPLIPCTACQYCMPCPYGVDIPSTFVHYNKCVCEGNYPESSQDENYAQARRAFLLGYDRSVPKLRQASHCINCNKCVVHCPQSIDIPQQMRKVDDYIESLKQNKL